MTSANDSRPTKIFLVDETQANLDVLQALLIWLSLCRVGGPAFATVVGGHRSLCPVTIHKEVPCDSSLAVRPW